MYQKIKTSLIVFVMTCTSILAQESWSLDECVAHALEHNLNLKDFEYNEASNKESYRQSVRNLLPSISGFSDYNKSFGRSEDPNTGGYVNSDFFSNNYSLNSSIDLFRGFQKINTIKVSKFLHKASMEDVEQQKYLLAFRVMSAYYEIKYFEGLLANSKEQKEISQTNYDLVKRQIELGLKAGADLYEAESLLLTDILTVTQNENNLQAARINLIQEMNLEGASTISLQPVLRNTSETKVVSQGLNQDSIYNGAMNFIPLIKAQELRAKAAKKNVAVARGNLYPSLSFAAGYGTGYFETNTDDMNNIIPFRTQIKDNTSRYIGFSLRVPISDKWSNRSRVKQQKIALLRAENSVQIQEQELYKTIQQLVQENNSLSAETAQSDKKVQSQQLAFTIAQKRYEKGLISALELFQAKTLFATAQNENLQVRLSAEVNINTLDFYKGLPIFNINN
jgi:outer membrane protein TolC